MTNNQRERQELKTFGEVLFFGFLMIAFIVDLRGKSAAVYLLGIGLFFLVISWISPMRLRLVKTVWMKIGHGLGWFNTRVLLGLIFFLLLTPIALVTRLFGMDLLDQKLQKEKESYWRVRKNPNLLTNYERLF